MHDSDEVVVGKFTGVDIFPTAIDTFDQAAHIEIPGSFVDKVDPTSLQLQGVQASSIGTLEDCNKDGEMDRAITFSISAVAAGLQTGISQVTLVGRMLEGTSIQETAMLEVR